MVVQYDVTVSLVSLLCILELGLIADHLLDLNRCRCNTYLSKRVPTHVLRLDLVRLV